MFRWFDRSFPDVSAHDSWENVPQCSPHPAIAGRGCRGNDPVSNPSGKQKQTLFTRSTALLWAGLSVVLALQWSRELSMLGLYHPSQERPDRFWAA
jgi:hypothetical protein